jgi:predicted transcriptional regulator
MSRKEFGMPRTTRITPGELELLEMLWREGPVTLSAAHAALGTEIGYTTVQTRLNRLVAKGLARRTEERPALYSAAIRRDRAGTQQLDLLVKSLGQGSVVPLVAHLVRDRSLSPQEIAELRALIAQSERQTKAEHRS